jgi:hypothetical protein
MSFRTRYNSRFSQYLTSCVACNRNTSKSFAKLHEGKCKNCSLPRCSAAYNEHCMTPGQPCGVHTPADSRVLVCPDCGGPISAYNLSKGYHCNACTRAIEGPAYCDQGSYSYEDR